MVKVKSLHSRQQARCYFCNCKTKLRTRTKNGKLPKMRDNHSTVEHLIPKSEGGSNRVINLKMSCNKCNTYRGTMNSVDWYKIASNPDKLEAHYKQLISKKGLRTVARRQRRRDEMLEQFGMFLEFIKIPSVQFNHYFGEQ